MESFIARQPIFNQKKQVVAYELLFRNGVQNSAMLQTTADGNAATSNVMTNALTLFGLENITKGKKAFINMTRDVLISQVPLAFDSSSLVIEILEDVPADIDVVSVLSHYKTSGYSIAMDDVVANESRDALVVLADIIKIDFMLTSETEQQQLAKRFLSEGKVLLAEKVETHAEFEAAVELGYTLFQGYFFAKPELLSRKEVRANKLNSLRLIAALQGAELALDELEEVIKNDVAMSYRLLRYINSAFFSFRVEISSIRQAIVLLGNREFRKWASLIAMSGLTDDKPEELLVTGLVRARFFELLAKGFQMGEQSDDLFLLGIFSILDGATDQTFETIFNEISLKSSIRDALLMNKGPYAAMMSAMRAFEAGDWMVFGQFVESNVRIAGSITETYLAAVEWANQSMTVIPTAG
ncbi:MAG: HDOD domain-containing protein [Deltaproteobacteria bacterium]|nr:HDOD domain-containing protein [Deltaproteobacteria bacterium]MBN2674044.1 HDOD domain-containing protein [Deltaproteobacteria bacterium]